MYLKQTADQDRNVSLSYVKMTYAVRSSNGSGVDVASGEPVDLSGAEPDDSVGWVERSTCPMQYEGETCQMCAPGKFKICTNGCAITPVHGTTV